MKYRTALVIGAGAFGTSIANVLSHQFSKIILKPVAFFQQIVVDNAYQVHSLKKVNSAASECRSCYSLGNVLSSDAPL